MTSRCPNKTAVRHRASATVLLVAMLAAGGVMAASQPGGVDLSPVPPNLTSSVDPNFVVSFDDSGSMVWTHMGDGRPYDGHELDRTSWDGPWRCAAVIDPRATDASSPLARGMNGVYYNPNVVYSPPLYEDGSAFPAADASLHAVPRDGIAVARPTAQPARTPSAFLDNSDADANPVNAGAAADITGTFAAPDTDLRWRCGAGAVSDGAWNAARGVQNPFDGTLADPDTGAQPNGGPLYWRFRRAAAAQLQVDAGTGLFTAAAKLALYDPANWEAVSVPAWQYQNFANWYAYYRTRTSMARSALSRVFGGLGNNLRVAWQNLGLNDNVNAHNPQLPSSAIITNLDNTTTFQQTDGLGPTGYRKAFFNWIYNVKSFNGTPSRAALFRAGEFFKRGNTADLRDPYWQPAAGDQPGQELACRQNFHLLVTDGLYNGGGLRIGGDATTTSTSQPLPTSPPRPDSNPASYTVGTGPTALYAGASTDADGGSTYSDLSFYYWANNLRADFRRSHPGDRVPAYFPDLTVGVTGAATALDPADPGANPEVFWNPANDPATWPHLVQFAIALGATGSLQYSDDIDCTKPDATGQVGNNDLCKLRKGVANSTGQVGWPRPNGQGAGIPANIDDLWHAALNSRGAFFVATDPTSLVRHLSDILNAVVARRTSNTSLSATMSVLTGGTQGFAAGFDSSDHSGFLTRTDLDGQRHWEAGCLLSRGTWRASGCQMPTPPPDARVSRLVFTSTGNTLIPFDWHLLSGAQQSALNQDPGADVHCASPQGIAAGCDGNGEKRAQWIAGYRGDEGAVLRRRASVLGAIVNSQPQYVSAPAAGFTDSFPAGSPEANAAAALGGARHGYQDFVQALRARAPTVYVGSDDGMLHAFDAQAGIERWAFIPKTLVDNGQLTLGTHAVTVKRATGVDNTPVIQDVFIRGAWHTVLIGALRLGGRGVFALDITDPGSPSLLWERSNDSPGLAHLGYVYGYPNVARLASGQWVALVPSGYFPLANQTPVDPASADTAANATSLFVIDIASGDLLREIQTDTAPQPKPARTFGLSAPAVYDLNADQIDDIAVAGDLAGNLWRFDLTASNPSSWSVDLMFQSYEAARDVGRRPISAMPVGMRDTFAKVPLWVFGTGKYLGLCDRTSSAPPTNCGADSNSAEQAVYGVRDAGTHAASYPATPASLATWQLTETSDGTRSVAPGPPSASRTLGWKLPLDVPADAGERVVLNVVPEYVQNFVVVATLIPSTPNPCNPARRGAVLVLDATTGGPRDTSPLAAATSPGGGGAGGVGAGAGSGGGGSATDREANRVVGKRVTSEAIPISGQLTVLALEGAGLKISGLDDFSIQTPPPHRSAWRPLLDNL